MFCPNCGHKVAEDHQFCSGCGAKLPITTEQDATPLAEEENAAPSITEQDAAPLTAEAGDTNAQGKLQAIFAALGKYKALLLTALGFWICNLILFVTPIFQISMTLFGMTAHENYHMFSNNLFGAFGIVTGIFYILIQAAALAAVALMFFYCKRISVPLCSWTVLASSAVSFLAFIALLIRGHVELGDTDGLVSLWLSGVGIVWILCFLATVVLTVFSIILLSKTVENMKSPLRDLSTLKK